MKNFCFAFCIALIFCINPAFGSEAGMPQLNPEFWTAQIFWLILIFSSLYLIIWKIFLPRITYSIENRKSRVVNDLNEAQKLKEKAEKKLREYNEIIEDSLTCTITKEMKCQTFWIVPKEAIPGTYTVRVTDSITSTETTFEIK